MRGHLAFARTLAHLVVWPSFFARIAAPLLVAALVGVAAHTAHAQEGPEPSWAIEITPSSLCRGDHDFESKLWSQIPDTQRAPVERAELRARVYVAQDRTATVAVFDQASQREAGQRRISLTQADCKSAGEALALVVAVLVEAGRALASAEPAEPPAPPAPAPPPAPPDAPAREPEPSQPARYARPERHAWQGPPAGHDVTALAGTNIGLLPGWAIGASLGWGIRGHRIWPIWIAATGWLDRQSSDHRGRFGAYYGTIATCPLAWTRTQIRMRLCPGFAMGAVWAQGRRLPHSEKKVPLLTMGVVEGALHVRLVGPLEFVVDARLEVPLERLKFVYYRTDGGTPLVHVTQPVTGVLFGGLGLRFR